MDSRLSYRQHINRVAAVASQRINKLYPLFVGPLPIKTKRTLYLLVSYSYDLSLLYAVEVWSHTHKRHLEPLRRIQRQFSRIILEEIIGLPNIFLNSTLNLIDITTYINSRW